MTWFIMKIAIGMFLIFLFILMFASLPARGEGCQQTVVIDPVTGEPIVVVVCP